jgi:hypothetical protein
MKNEMKIDTNVHCEKHGNGFMAMETENIRMEIVKIKMVMLL